MIVNRKLIRNASSKSSQAAAATAMGEIRKKFKEIRLEKVFPTLETEREENEI